MVYPSYHLPHFDYCQGSAWSRWSMESLSLLHWSADWIICSLLNMSDCIFDSPYLWQFWNVLPWYHSCYCKSAFMISDSLALDQTPCVGNSTHPSYWSGSSRTHPNDYDSKNTVSSLQFQTASSEVGTTSYQESTIESTVLEIDIEAQQEQSDELVVVVERMK